MILKKAPSKVKTKVKKPKRITTSAAKVRAWKAFSMYIRLRDALATTQSTTHGVCCSCGKTYPAFGIGCLQAGHFIPGRHNANLFDERGCHAQCYVCNVRMKGNWARYYEFMLTRYGQAVIDELIAQDKIILQRMPHQLQEMETTYKQKAQQLRQKGTP